MRKAILTMFVAALLAGGSVGAAVAQGAGAGTSGGGAAGTGMRERHAAQLEDSMAKVWRAEERSLRLRLNVQSR